MSYINTASRPWSIPSMYIKVRRQINYKIPDIAIKNNLK